MDNTTSKIGSLSSNLATFLYLIHDKGIKIQDQTISDICQKINTESKKLSLSKMVELFNQATPNKSSIETGVLAAFLQENANDNVFRTEYIFDLAKDLIAAIENSVSSEATFAEAFSWLQERIPQIQSGFGPKSRNGKIQAIRHYEFQQSLPWLARVTNRTDSRKIEQWIMVGKVTEVVHCMDPNPWDDIEEEFNYSLNDFMIRWELCAYEAIFLGEG